MRDASTLPSDLRSAIERAGYYPALVADVVESALGAETPSSRTWSTRRRRSTRTPSAGTSRCWSMTPTRLVIAHADDHSAETAEGAAPALRRSRRRRARRSR